MATVGFIGLGQMGNHMARNLLKKSFRVIAFDVDPKRQAELKSDGAEIVKYPADVAAATKQLVTMLPNSAIVRSVFKDSKGILETITPGTLCIDSSTIDQIASVEIAKLTAEKGASYIDAPVSGGVGGAQAGTLTFMVGGPQKDFDRAKPLLQNMGKSVVHCGDVGTGQAAKICNNMLLGIEMIGVAEAMNLGVKMGLDPKLLAGIINTSSGRCWSSDTYNPVPHVIEGIPSCKNYEGGFGASLMAKDLGLAQTASTETKAPTPLGSLAHQIYRLLAKHPDYKNKDFGVVYQFLKDN
uniref:3-hydroxyisobutyrate dehydrogenase n=1 Tax=Panagrolaimus sp. JU765 TaxID=591449 RepID=A0AC34QAH1_9BILA